MQKTRDLNQWLEYLLQLHLKEIDMGLQRVQAVFERLALNLKPARIVLIGGTNGKGTSCRLMQQLLTAHGYSVGCYNSPHIKDYRERVTVDGEWLSESRHCQAFAIVEEARGETPLTFFEFSTLAALVLLAQAKLDFILLEVGLGGRLDATNIVDPELSVITTIALDHQEWLGHSRELIGAEKAGIFRHRGKAVCGDYNPPISLSNIAADLETDIRYQNKDFKISYEPQTDGDECWSWQGHSFWPDLPVPNMPLQNASTVMAAFEQLNVKLDPTLLKETLHQFTMPGRWQKIASAPDLYLDVAHNPEAIEYLAKKLAAVNISGQKIAVVGMLHDKDFKKCLSLLNKVFDVFYLADIQQPRGAKAKELAQALPENKIMGQYQNLTQACQAAKLSAQSQDVIVALGSFWVVSELMS
ncbi:bifunctional tetrahydrofolate synthase/dihydrofolate synthase [Gayadomonas joobiniege]|uniref:bifunctional tetrahydrofolate synthase/dihydrofolate synthase n=1 Tax=Gayadomonas joobiniege TaxID=1234606 RepID=UPI000373C916|nr:bifunctional tetrahydrofolate synthase/dihydrofolate synthase [Gayadomonas joobiniege]